MKIMPLGMGRMAYMSGVVQMVNGIDYPNTQTQGRQSNKGDRHAEYFSYKNSHDTGAKSYIHAQDA